MKVTVMSRKRLESLDPFPDNTAIISIRGMGDTEIDPYCKALNSPLQFFCVFDDIVWKGDENNIPVITDDGAPFYPGLANSIWEFAAKVADKQMDLIVHCAAGISRSAAVGRCIASEWGVELICCEGSIHPNPDVLKWMNRVLWGV